MAFGRPTAQFGGRQQAQLPGQQNASQAQPGQAQSQQSPYATSTAYNPQQAQPFSAWSPQQAPSRPATPAYDPNVANNPQANRPPAFQSQSFNFDGTQSQMPDYARRDAMIGQINNQLGQMQSQSWNQQMGAPQFNFSQMWDQAGNMVQQGWQNPFSQQQSAPAPQAASSGSAASIAPQDSAAAIRNLLQGYNVPQNVMEQLAGMFGGQQTSQPPATGASSPGQASPIQDPYANSGPYGESAPAPAQTPVAWDRLQQHIPRQLRPLLKLIPKDQLTQMQADLQQELGHLSDDEMAEWAKTAAKDPASIGRLLKDYGMPSETADKISQLPQWKSAKASPGQIAGISVYADPEKTLDPNSRHYNPKNFRAPSGEVGSGGMATAAARAYGITPYYSGKMVASASDINAYMESNPEDAALLQFRHAPTTPQNWQQKAALQSAMDRAQQRWGAHLALIANPVAAALSTLPRPNAAAVGQRDADAQMIAQLLGPANFTPSAAFKNVAKTGLK